MKVILWYLNNCDEPEDEVLSGFENGFRPIHGKDFIDHGVWIKNQTTWIPPHRMLKVVEEEDK